ncbi:unnamed protein product, partial [Meganyctiphanes norvegica]
NLLKPSRDVSPVSSEYCLREGSRLSPDILRDRPASASSMLACLSRRTSASSAVSRPTSPCCPLGGLAQNSTATSPLHNYGIDNVLLWSSTIFNPPDLIVNGDARGRSKSLTHINTLGAGSDMLSRGESMEAGGPHHETLGVPSSRSHHHSFRRKKLSVANRPTGWSHVHVLTVFISAPCENSVVAYGRNFQVISEILLREMKIVHEMLQGEFHLKTPNALMNNGGHIGVTAQRESKLIKASERNSVIHTSGPEAPRGRPSE